MNAKQIKSSKPVRAGKPTTQAPGKQGNGAFLKSLNQMALSAGGKEFVTVTMNVTADMAAWMALGELAALRGVSIPEALEQVLESDGLCENLNDTRRAVETTANA